MNPYAQYKQTQVQTAPPETLVLMLYDGAIRFLEQARRLSQTGADPGESITRAQDIILELMNSLNMEAGPIAEHLYRLYDYYLFRLIRAYGARDPEIVAEVLQHLRDLREAWGQAVLQVRGQDGEQTQPAGMAAPPGGAG